jgi:hypothetical protein
VCDRATGTCPRAHPPLAHRRSTCGRRPVLQRERAHSGSLSRVGRGVGSGHGRDLGDRTVVAGLQDWPRVQRAEVVFDVTLPLLLLGERDVEVEVESRSRARMPTGSSSPCGACRPGWRQWEPAIQPSSPRRDSRHQGQLLPLFGQLVAAARELLLGLEQLESACEPLLPRPSHVLRHRVSSFCRSKPPTTEFTGRRSTRDTATRRALGTGLARPCAGHPSFRRPSAGLSSRAS